MLSVTNVPVVNKYAATINQAICKITVKKTPYAGTNKILGFAKMYNLICFMTVIDSLKLLNRNTELINGKSDRPHKKYEVIVRISYDGSATLYY